MKKTIKLLIATAAPFIVSASSLFAQIATTGYIGTGSLTINAPNYNGSDGYDQAGPYSVTINSESGVKPVSTTFQTFCIGTEVDYYPGSTYNYQISDNVEPDPVGSAAGSGSVGSPGYVTWGTAYLYSQFLAGNLGVGGASSTPAAVNATDDALQIAIWDLQLQPTVGITLNSGDITAAVEADVTTFLEDATNAATAHSLSVTNEANGAFGVYALNMYPEGSSSYVQPQLVEVPCPEPSTVFAGAMLLVPLGVSAVRKLRKKS